MEKANEMSNHLANVNVTAQKYATAVVDYFRC